MEQTTAAARPASPSDKPKIILTKDLIKSTLDDYKQNWQKFAYLLIIPLSVSYILSLCSFISDKFGFAASMPWQFKVAAVILFIILLLAVGIIYVLTYISEFLLVKDLTQEVNSGNLRDWYKRARPYFWISVGISVIYSILTLVGIILLIVPGVIFAISYCFAIYAVIFEDHKFEGAFGRSRELVKGYWWAVFGRFMAGGALIYLAYLVIGGIYAGLVWLISYSMHLQPQSGKDLFQLMYDLLSIFIGIVVGPLTMLYTYKIFQSLKAVKNI